jgi:hypothetical protein
MRNALCTTKWAKSPALDGGPRCSDEQADFLHDLYGANECANERANDPKIESPEDTAWYAQQLVFAKQQAAERAEQRAADPRLYHPRRRRHFDKRKASAAAFAALYS